MQAPADSRKVLAYAGARERKKHLTRQELLAAGRRLFGEQGLYEARIEDVSESAGVAKGTLYGYFHSKEELAFEVVSLGFHDLQRQVRLQLGRASRPFERIERILQAHIDFFERNPDLLRVFHQVRGVLKFNQPGWRPLRRAMTQHIGFLAQQLQRRSGREGRAIALYQARTLFGVVSGILSVHVALDPHSRRPGMSRPLMRGVIQLIRALDTDDTAVPAVRSPRAPAM
jgi:AcrR family transcriptional regulator